MNISPVFTEKPKIKKLFDRKSLKSLKSIDENDSILYNFEDGLSECEDDAFLVEMNKDTKNNENISFNSVNTSITNEESSNSLNNLKKYQSLFLKNSKKNSITSIKSDTLAVFQHLFKKIKRRDAKSVFEDQHTSTGNDKSTSNKSLDTSNHEKKEFIHKNNIIYNDKSKLNVKKIKFEKLFLKPLPFRRSHSLNSVIIL